MGFAVRPGGGGVGGNVHSVCRGGGQGVWGEREKKGRGDNGVLDFKKFS